MVSKCCFIFVTVCITAIWSLTRTTVIQSYGEWYAVPVVCSSTTFRLRQRWCEATQQSAFITTCSYIYLYLSNIGQVCPGPNTTLFIYKSSLFQSSLLHCTIHSSGLSDPGNHLSAGKHPGHYSYNKEQEPPLTHVLLRLQVNSSHNNPPFPFVYQTAGLTM